MQQRVLLAVLALLALSSVQARLLEDGEQLLWTQPPQCCARALGQTSIYISVCQWKQRPPFPPALSDGDRIQSVEVPSRAASGLAQSRGQR